MPKPRNHFDVSYDFIFALALYAAFMLGVYAIWGTDAERTHAVATLALGIGCANLAYGSRSRN